MRMDELDKDKVAQLMKTPSGELAEIEPSKWDAMFSSIHSEDLRLLSNSLIRLSEKAIRMSAYIDVRCGGHKGDTGHSEAVRAQNKTAEKLRALLGFQYPAADIDF
jgi:hypothetical protein